MKGLCINWLLKGNSWVIQMYMYISMISEKSSLAEMYMYGVVLENYSAMISK